MNYTEKNSKLQKLMKEQNIDTFVLTKFDPHQSEDGGDYYHLPKYFSGFTGSNAKLIITQNELFIYTDGRYYAQCKYETEANGYVLVKESEANSIPFLEYAIKITKENGTIGIVPDALSVAQVLDVLPKFKEKNITLKSDIDLINEVWTDRAFAPSKKIYDLDVKYTGEDRTSKINRVREVMTEKGAKNYILSSLDDIAYVLNIRGFDIPYNTFFYSFMIFEENKTTLFVDLEKISEVKEILEKDGINILAYEQIFDYISNLKAGTKTIINVNKTCHKIYTSGSHLNFISEKNDITEHMKCIKNETELENIRQSSIRDNVALVRAFRRIKKNANNLNEYDVNNILLEERQKEDLFIIESFHPICAYMGNGSMAHYHATKDSHSNLKNEGILLIDSGATYYDGTTDITRTIALGEVSKEIKTDFTLVLKSHIKVARAKFLSTATGSKLDAIAREPMWNVGRNYNHGTGHGIAFVGPVHEGPQSMGFKDNGVPLRENMILSNEPALYVDNQYGIRTENTVGIAPFMQTNDGTFFQFETLSYCPIDLDLVDKSMLTEEELFWLNDYHYNVYTKLSPYLQGDDLEFLIVETRRF